MIRGRVPRSLNVSRRSEDGFGHGMAAAALSKYCLKMHTRTATIGGCSITHQLCGTRLDRSYRSKWVSGIDLY